MEVRWYVKYYKIDNGKKGEAVNSMRILQFRVDALSPWQDVEVFDDTVKRDELEVTKKPPEAEVAEVKK